MHLEAALPMFAPVMLQIAPHFPEGTTLPRQWRKRQPNHLLDFPEIPPGMENSDPQPIYTSSLTSPVRTLILTSRKYLSRIPRLKGNPTSLN